MGGGFGTSLLISCWLSSSQILDSNPTLHFHLLQLRLIELIRQSKIGEALVFAQTELAPRGEEHPQFLKELERTMALLAFELPKMLSSDSPAPPTALVSKDSGKKKEVVPVSMPDSIASLLDQSQRLATAAELNAAILSAQSHGKDPKLPGLMKMLAWGELLLREKVPDFPQCTSTSSLLEASSELMWGTIRRGVPRSTLE